MASRIYLYSTLTCDNLYTLWNPTPPGGTPVPKRQILVAGGANVATKQLTTPLGTRTEVNEEELALLEENHTFKTHVKNGFIVVRKDKIDPEVAAAAGMKQRDQSAPMTPESDEFKPLNAKPMKDNTKDAPIGAA